MPADVGVDHQGRKYIAPVPPRHPLLAALEPVAEALGATLVPPSRIEPDDIPLRWEGDVVGGMRLPGVHGTLDRMIGAVESQLGAPLAELSREDKQRAVRLLDQRGAFQLRKSVEDVADALRVSRFTVYNYLNADTRNAEAR
jgi:HTH domain